MILVTGCTGFVGASLVRQLLAAGYAVRGLVRDPHQSRDPTLPAIPIMAGSITDPEALSRAMAGVETVIHLVGILVERGDQTFERVHCEGVKNVVDAARGAGVRRYLHMSALGTRPRARSRYHQTKWCAEEYVRASGLDYTIFRPSVIFGPLDRFVNPFAAIIRHSPLVPLLGDGASRMQPVWVEDVARCFLGALENPQTCGHTYELGGPDQLSLREILEAIVTAMGRRRLLLRLPFPLLTVQAAIMERLLPNPPLTTDQLIMAREENVCDTTPMRQTFLFEPRSFHDGLRDYRL